MKEIVESRDVKWVFNLDNISAPARLEESIKNAARGVSSGSSRIVDSTIQLSETLWELTCL